MEILHWTASKTTRINLSPFPWDEALDGIFEIDEGKIAGETGVETIIIRLNCLFKKGSIITKYQAFNSFMTFKRWTTMSIQAFLNEFDKRLFKTKTYGTIISDNILGYQLLKLANLLTHHEALIEATIPDLQ